MTGDGEGPRGGSGEPAPAATAEADASDPVPGLSASRDEPHAPAVTALLLDAMHGKLATYLRMCGYDATYAGERGVETDDEVLAVAATEDRVVVTRDRDLARRAERSTLLEERAVADQLRELRAAGFALELADEPVRCSACNGPLERVDRTEPTPDYAPESHEEMVWRCRGCGQHFWKGSHWDDVAETLDAL